MRFFEAVKDFALSRVKGTDPYWRREAVAAHNEADFVRESMSRLQLELENYEYVRISQYSEFEFTRHRVQDLIRLSVAMYLKNPIVNRSANVQADYVFGRGVNIVAKHPLVQKVIDEFLNYEKNRRALTSHSSMLRREREQQIAGNLFILLITNPRTGRVTIRFIDTQEVVDVFRDPNDYEQEWFVKRSWTDEAGKPHVEYYPCLGCSEDEAYLPPSEPQMGGVTRWDCRIYHVFNNRVGHMKFGIPELYPQLDWALAYKGFLENWSSIMRAFARMAMKVTGLSSRKQAAAAKGLLQTSVSLSNPFEKNPSVAAGATPLLGKGVDVEPVKTAGATTDASAGAPLLNMAAAGAGLPNHFYGDSSQGNYSTAKTLDRPTELKMYSRQNLWDEILTVIIGYAILQAARAPQGILAEAGAVVNPQTNPFDNSVLEVIEMPVNTDEYKYYGEVGEPISLDFEINFPDILERNVTDRVRALVNAVTMFGKPLTDIIPDKRFVAKLLLQALNIDEVDKLIPVFISMWEVNMKAEPGEPVNAITIPPPPPQGGAAGAEDPSQGGDKGANG